MDKRLNPTTGRIKNDGSTIAFCFNKIEIPKSGAVNLWDYSVYQEKGEPIKFMLGKTLEIAQLCDTSSHPERSKSNIRKLTALAYLDSETPFVYVKKIEDR